MRGYEGSPSDDGNASFAYPLATGQRLHRISDRFPTTPVEGLNDFFLAWEVVGVLPFVNGFLGYHHYRTDQGFDSLGHEVDLVLSFPVLTHLTIGFTGGPFFIGERDEDPDAVIAAIDFVINIWATACRASSFRPSSQCVLTHQTKEPPCPNQYMHPPS